MQRETSMMTVGPNELVGVVTAVEYQSEGDDGQKTRLGAWWVTVEFRCGGTMLYEELDPRRLPTPGDVTTAQRPEFGRNPQSEKTMRAVTEVDGITVVQRMAP